MWWNLGRTYRYDRWMLFIPLGEAPNSHGGRTEITIPRGPETDRGEVN